MVCVDFDGVLVDFLGALKRSLAKKGLNYIIENTETYDFDGEIGVSKSDIYKEMHKPDMYNDIEFFEGAFEALNELKSYETVKPYTGSVNNKKIADIRNNLIKKLDLDGRAYVNSSKPIIKDANAIFEDDLDKLIEYIENDYKGFLFLIKHSYNNFNKDTIQYKDKIIVCNNFVDAVDKYKKLKGHESL